MKIQWNTVLSIEHLCSINCWATLEEMQQVIPFHADRFSQIVLNCSHENTIIPAHDLSFSTSFIVAVLFLMVKASRPMTYQFLTVNMINGISRAGGIIDQTQFKTNYTYSFDSLVISKEVIDILNGYIECIRPRLQPQCEYLLVTRTGKQLQQLSNVFGRIVYLAIIGKHIHPTRYRQIIETESATKLNPHEQNILSKDQKHTSNVARVHYQKLQSREVALEAQRCMHKLIGNRNPWNVTVTGRSNDVNNPTECNNDSRQEISSMKDTHSLQADMSKQHATEVNNVTESLARVQFSISKHGHKIRQKKVAFSKEEDSFIQRGIKKYGPGRWTSILSDIEFSFHSSRKCSTLLLRAKKLKLI